MDQRPYKVSFFVDKASASRIIHDLSELLGDRGVRFVFFVTKFVTLMFLSD